MRNSGTLADHFLDGFRVRELWTVIVAGEGALAPGAYQVVAQALPILARWLPRVGSKTAASAPVGGDPGAGGQGPAELGIPVWWIRNRASG